MRFRHWTRFAFSLALISCGDDKGTAGVDAPKPPIDSPKDIDAPSVAPVDYTSFEGGEVRLEYLTFPAGAPQQTRARATAFFWDGAQGDGFHPLPDVPGCTDFTVPPARWPFTREPNAKQLDVGQVIIAGHGGSMQLDLPSIVPVKGACSVTTGTGCFSNTDCPATETCNGAVGTRDNLGRLYKEPWRFAGENPSPMNLNNMAGAFITPDTTYDIIFTGSANWPAQVLKDALYVPEAWTLNSPAPDVNPVLQADQDLVITYDTPPQLNRPAGYPENTLVHFILGANTALVTCVQEGTPGTITIPKDLINKVRALAPAGGKFVRQHATHVPLELTDGVTHNNKRIDVIGIWCYNYTFTVAP